MRAVVATSSKGACRRTVGWVRALGLLGAAITLLLASGCGDELGARRFAITVTESATLDCAGYPGPFVEQDTVDALAKSAEKAWRDAHEREPATPQGNVLYLLELEGSVQAWLESASYDAAVPWAGLSGPSVVYAGQAHPGYLDLSYADSFNTDADDELFGLQPCGDRLHALGVLSGTLVGDILEGRVRWTEVQYVGSAFAACDGRVECARDVALAGSSFARP